MKTFEEAAPSGGTTLFHMSGLVTATVPLTNSFNPSVIREELQEHKDEMNCEINLEDMNMLEDQYSASLCWLWLSNSKNRRSRVLIFPDYLLTYKQTKSYRYSTAYFYHFSLARRYPFFTYKIDRVVNSSLLVFASILSKKIEALMKVSDHLSE